MRELISELKRRNVFRVGVAYVVVAWLLAQVSELALGSFGAPDWALKTLLFLLALGFPLAIFFAWAFELTPDGLKREREVDRSRSITPHTGRKLDYIIIAVLVVAVGFLLADKFLLNTQGPETNLDIAATSDASVENDDPGRSIAVLPFVDMSPTRDQAYFTDGLTENLLNALAKIGEIKVAGRTSSFAFKDRNEDLRSIGEQLNVANILEGSVQKAGNRVRITAQLVSADDGFHLWSEAYDRDLHDIFEVQDEITANVVGALRKNLLGEQQIDTGYSGNVDAYNAYLQGRYLASKKNFESWDLAIAEYRRALEIDPQMALAWAGLAQVVADKTGFDSQDFAKGYERAREAALKALALEPDLPEAHMALADVQRSYDWDWAAAEASLNRALAQRPGDPEIRAQLARLKTIRGDTQEAIKLIDQALAVDPLNDRLQMSRAWALVYLDRHAEAIPIAERQLELHPDRGANAVALAVAYRETGELQRALEIAQREKFDFLRLTLEAMLYHDLGDQQTAQQKLAELVEGYGDAVSYQVAAVYTSWGDYDAAFAALERGYEIRDPGLPLIQSHSTFDPLRGDPRFEQLLQKMGFQ